MSPESGAEPLALTPAAALYGWGQKGHRIVADIAQERLTEVTNSNVQSLIGNNTLASVANWIDQIRPERDETYNWHFVDIPKDAQGFSDSRDCYRPQDTHKGARDDHQNCVVGRIEYFKRVLGDKSASRDDRIEALKFIVHFVGDIHQPLHAIGEAKGGDGVHITEFGSDRCGRYPCNPHSAWDTGPDRAHRDGRESLRGAFGAPGRFFQIAISLIDTYRCTI